MSVFEEFKRQIEYLKSRIKEDEYVRVDAGGIRVLQIVCRERHDGNVVLVHGIDAAGQEAIAVVPGDHFNVKLSVCKKTKERREIGFKAAFDDKDAVNVMGS